MRLGPAAIIVVTATLGMSAKSSAQSLLPSETRSECQVHVGKLRVWITDVAEYESSQDNILKQIGDNNNDFAVLSREVKLAVEEYVNDLVNGRNQEIKDQADEISEGITREFVSGVTQRRQMPVFIRSLTRFMRGTRAEVAIDTSKLILNAVPKLMRMDQHNQAMGGLNDALAMNIAKYRRLVGRMRDLLAEHDLLRCQVSRDFMYSVGRATDDLVTINRNTAMTLDVSQSATLHRSPFGLNRAEPLPMSPAPRYSSQLPIVTKPKPLLPAGETRARPAGNKNDYQFCVQKQSRPPVYSNLPPLQSLLPECKH